MGLLDDLLRSALSQANVSNPLMQALLALLSSGALFGGDDRETAPTKTGGPRSPGDEGGGLLEGLGGLLDRFRQSGQGKAADSWIGTGSNDPVSPGQLGNALGPNTSRRLPSGPACRRMSCLGSWRKLCPRWSIN